MNLPLYARNWVEQHVPTDVNQAQSEGRHCVYCDVDFEAKGRKPQPVDDSDLRACRYCLEGLIVGARRERDRLAEEQRRQESANRISAAKFADDFLDAAGALRTAVRHIEGLMDAAMLEPPRLAFLMLELMAAKFETDKLRWKCVELDVKQLYLLECGNVALHLDRAVDRLQSEACEALAYAVINAYEGPSPEFCAEQGCPESCDSVHEIVEIDLEPDAVFKSLEDLGFHTRKPVLDGER
jgi:hypothetical protein